MKAIDIEVMTDILSDLNISATKDQIQIIVADFIVHLEMEQEMSRYQHVGYKEACPTCELLKKELKAANKDIEAYKNSVKTRRGAERVWIDSHGEVRYE